MQAITTKYVGPTNSRGSRVIAKCQAGKLTMHWDEALNPDENHDAAAKALVTKLGWGGEWHGGGLPDGTGNVYVCALREGPAFITKRKKK